MTSQAVIPTFFTIRHRGEAIFRGGFVTGLAAIPIVGDLTVSGRQAVRIMTRNTSHLAGALLVAATGGHLFDLPHRPEFIRKFRRSNERSQEQVQGQPRPIFPELPPPARNPPFSLQMALLADRIAQHGGQMAWMDNVLPSSAAFSIFLPAHVQIPGTMATLAADCLALEVRQVKPVHGILHRLNLIGVAEQAVRADRSFEMAIMIPVARGKIPLFLMRIPTNR